jgi:hypothetical protein
MGVWGRLHATPCCAAVGRRPSYKLQLSLWCGQSALLAVAALGLSPGLYRPRAARQHQGVDGAMHGAKGCRWK